MTDIGGPLPTKDVEVNCQHCGAARVVNVPDPLEPGCEIGWSCYEDVAIEDGERVVVGGCNERGGTITGPAADPIPPIPPMKWDAGGQRWTQDPEYAYEAETNRWVRA